MSTSSPQTPLSRVRTFASDLTTVRSKQNISAKPTDIKIAPQAEPLVEMGTGEKIIPPFHTLNKSKKINVEENSLGVPQNNIPTVTQREAQKIITEKSAISKNNAVAESMPAVIITDTKRKRYSFSEALKDSLVDWWNQKKETARKNKTPKYTVPEADRRKGVIQKATVKTGRTSSADHAAVVSRIKATKTIPHEPIIKTKTTASDSLINTPTWESSEAKPATKTQVEPTQTAVITNIKIEPKKNNGVHTHQNNNWESDLQIAVNGLNETKSDSKIILTGKEFTRIKQQKVSTPPTVLDETPKIKPIIPVIPVQAEIRTTVAPSLPLPTEVIRETQNETMPAELEKVNAEDINVVDFIPPTPITRPKITPIIPPQISNEVVTEATSSKTQTREILVPFMPVTADPALPPILTRPAENKTERRFAPPRPRSRSWLETITQTNSLVFIISFILIIVVVGSLSLRYYLSNPKENVVADVSTLNKPTTFSNSVLYNESIYVSNKNELATSLLERSTGSDSLVEINFINATVNSELTPKSFFSLFNASVLFDFESSLTDINLGGYRGEPWLTFTITDKTTALGGMLQWENNLLRDLNLIFGSTSGFGSAKQFTDNQIGGVDVRQIKDSSGLELVTYGFVGYNTLLITTDTTAFLNLANNIQ